MKTVKKYDVTQCALYKCQSKKRLESLLNIEAGDLKKLNSAISYHSFEIDKKGSTEKRGITAPDRILKQIQARILQLIQRVYRPDWLISGEKGKCYIDNGRAHLLNNYVLTMDIKKFYDNCAREPVYHFFLDYLKAAADIAKILTDIVTYNGGIPTGCPTSQLIAYYAYQEMFHQIADVSKAYGCTFTLYVDDMTFSANVPFEPKKLARDVDRILRRYGHSAKRRKIKYYSKNDSKPITGTIITPEHTLDIPNNLQQKIFENFQEVKVCLDVPARLGENEKTVLTLKGQIQAAKNIDENRFPEISRLTNKISIPVISAERKKSKKKRNRQRIRIA